MLQKFKKLILLVIPITMSLTCTSFARSWFRVSFFGGTGLTVAEAETANWETSWDRNYNKMNGYETGDSYATLTNINSPYTFPHAGEKILIHHSSYQREWEADKAGCTSKWAAASQYRPKGSDRNLGRYYLYTIPNGAHGQYIRFYMNPCEGGSESEGYYYTQPFNCYVQLYPSNHSHQWGGWVSAALNRSEVSSL